MVDESSGEVKEVDFGKDVEAWKYVEKGKVLFQEHKKVYLVEGQDENTLFQMAGNSKIVENDKMTQVFQKDGNPRSTNEKKMESYGVFLMQRSEPITVLATLVNPKHYDDPEVQQAMETELERWNEFDAYEVVEDYGQERIDGRWIVNKKEEHDGLKVNLKARYCLRGFKEQEKPRSDSPTVDRLSTKLLYAFAGNHGWKIESIDVTAAFLQGSDLDRDIFVKPPKEAKMNGFLWKMKKAAYGLYDASRRWWVKVMEVMIELGGRTLVGDESLIYFLKAGNLIGMISLHVDDFQGAGEDLFMSSVMDVLATKFKISKR